MSTRRPFLPIPLEVLELVEPRDFGVVVKLYRMAHAVDYRFAVPFTYRAVATETGSTTKRVRRVVDLLVALELANLEAPKHRANRSKLEVFRITRSQKQAAKQERDRESIARTAALFYGQDASETRPETHSKRLDLRSEENSSIETPSSGRNSEGAFEVFEGGKTGDDDQFASLVLKVVFDDLDAAGFTHDDVTNDFVAAVAAGMTEQARNGHAYGVDFRDFRPKYADVARVLRAFATPRDERKKKQ